MRCLSLAVASAAVLLAGVPVAADTPNHCLWDQAAGSWTIYVTAPTPSRDGCPSDSSALAIVDAFNVTLSAPDVATTSSGQAGWWSMLYDEGMHIRLPPASSVGGPGSHFFSFFNWTVDASNNVTSHCNRTNVGDYRAEVVTPGARPDFWGCFYGVKQGSSARDLTVQPLRVVAPAPADAVVVTDHAFAARLNAQQSLWKAGATPAFHGMRMNAARRQAGKVRHHDLAAMKPRMPAGVAKRQPAISAADLPPAFDWRNVSGVDYVCPVRSQGQCGSCYSFGSTGSLCARTAIQTKGAISGRYWSPQAVVSCNPYTQGCDGGFSYDVFFGAEGLGLPWESCFPYTSGADGSVPPCSAMCADQSQFNSVTDVSFVGGYYGGATAELMQVRRMYSDCGAWAAGV